MTETERPTLSTRARDVVILARAIVQGGPYEAIEPILRGQRSFRGVSEDALRIVEDTLAKGCVLALARLGGWRRFARIDGAGGTKVGRLWEVHPPALAFSAYAFELLRWLVAEPLGALEHAKVEHAKFERRPETAGDELLAYLTCALIEGYPLASVIAQETGLRASALAWLGFPLLLAGAKKSREVTEKDFHRLVENGVLLEALVDDLSTRAVSFEQSLNAFSDPALLSNVAEAREWSLGALVDAAEAKNRCDLMTFLVDATALLLPAATDPRASAARLVGTLDPKTTLRDRSEARRAAGGHLRVMGRLAKTEERSRLVRFFDEDYDASQALLARWERLGKDGFSRAADVLQHLGALDGG